MTSANREVSDSLRGSLRIISKPKSLAQVPHRLKRGTLAVGLTLAIFVGEIESTHAATVYWDTNGTLAGWGRTPRATGRIAAIGTPIRPVGVEE